MVAELHFLLTLNCTTHLAAHSLQWLQGLQTSSFLPGHSRQSSAPQRDQPGSSCWEFGAYQIDGAGLWTPDLLRQAEATRVPVMGLAR